MHLFAISSIMATFSSWKLAKAASRYLRSLKVSLSHYNILSSGRLRWQIRGRRPFPFVLWIGILALEILLLSELRDRWHSLKFSVGHSDPEIQGL